MPNKTCSKILTLIVLLTGVFSQAAEVYVSPNGKDSNTGDSLNPLATVSAALRKARELRRLNKLDKNEGIQIIMKDGLYRLYEPILLRPEDSGTPNSPTVIRAEGKSRPIISGGIKIENWRRANTTDLNFKIENNANNVWVANLPHFGGNIVDFRQMWVDGEKAKRATNLGEKELDRVLSVDTENEIMWIPTPEWDFKNPEDLEFIIHQWWAIANLRVKSLERRGDSTAVKFHQPESKIEFEHPWPAPFIDSKKEYNGNSAFYFTGAAELLSEPGEWYLDKRNLKVYYYPKNGKNPNKTEIIAPVLENLVKIKGTLDKIVSNIQFENINFQHSTWMRPSKEGHVPLQAGWSIIDAYKLEEPGTPDKAALENQAWIERQPASFEVLNARNIKISGCKFSHLAATGLDFISGVTESEIIGNVFEDIGGTAIQAAFFGGSEFEAHLPYQPKDHREIVHHLNIHNNYITNVTNEDWGCVGISIGVAHDIDISHNEVSNINYSGICLGWSWTKTISIAKNNRIHANRIHNFAKQMYDVGGIYTLSAQPNTEISENAIYDLKEAPYAHMPHHHQYIYYDEGSSYIRSINNWTEKDKFFENSPGPGNLWENNGPGVAKEIKDNAGLQPEFQKIKNEYGK
ncbi:right-handed parallel beta-helix repeat-containing protein [Zunongwangia endophytica]|uniref:Right-handed parallel beta-helix repeat-containing protein n=1 Tax=Zunongwangia endophytica TaxID=1808945 RepID=A0ABV8H6C2_9FLAO|nr:right-handed parallel beta-helix repeat-containing protein [Zunongwangia endophytica]MDN3594858.1 right-handed parallel beta-helix repeat-containing protein [Zunongwangia endophytica]